MKKTNFKIIKRVNLQQEGILKLNKININLAFVMLVIFMLSTFTNLAFAAKIPTTKEMIDKGLYYYDPVDNTCTDQQNSSSNDLQDNGNKKIYQSGIDPDGPFILEMFAIHILKALAEKTNKPESDFVTKQHVVALVAFSIGEGGDINNQSVFNPMNLGLSADDLPTKKWGAGTDGTQSYASFDVGVEAYARQFLASNQDRLGIVLSKKESKAADFMYALTHFEKYKGNAFWAAASLPVERGGIGVDKYYKGRIDLVKSVINNYEKTAGLIIGTTEYEQPKGMYKPSLLEFKDAGSDSVDDYTSSTSTNACDNSSGNQGTAGATGWELTGENKMVVYRQSDPKWSGKSYSNCGTIGKCGCWVVTTAIAISTLTNKNINPGQLLDKYGNSFYPTTPATKEGLVVDEIGSNFDDAEKTLKNGGLIAAYFLSGTFTTVEHMMIIRKVSNDGKRFYVYDLRGINDKNNTDSYTREDLLDKANLERMYAISKKGSD